MKLANCRYTERRTDDQDGFLRCCTARTGRERHDLLACEYLPRDS